MAGAGGTEVGRISIRCVPNTDRFRQELKAQLEAIERSMKCVIDVEPNLKGFRAKVKAATSNLPDATVDVNANTQKLRDSVKKSTDGIQLQLDDKFDYKLRQRLAKMKPKVEVDVDVKRGALGRLASTMSRINKSTMPSFGSGINLGGYAVIITGIMAVLAPALGLLATSLLALPGLIAAIAVPIAAVTLGLDGFKEAAKSLEKPFNDLKDTMSKVAKDTFTPVFEKLAGIFPSLQRTLPSVTSGLATMADSVVSVITSQDGMKKIEGTISNIGQALRDAAPGVGDFTNGLLTLAESLTAKFPGLTKWFNDTGKSFTEWVDKITRKDWFTGKSQLDTAFEGLGGTLKTLLDAGGGWLEKGFEFMKDPKKIDDFNAALGRLGDTIERIVQLSSDFYSALEKIDKSHQNRTLEDEGTWAWIREGFDPKNLFGPNTVDFNGMWNGFKEAATTAFAAVVASAGLFVTNIAAKVMSLGSILSGAWGGILAAAQGAWNGVVNIVASVMSQVIGQFSQVPAAFSSAWSGIASAAASIFGQVVSAVANAIAQVVAAVVSGGAQVVGEVASWPGKIASALAGLAATGAEAGRALVQGLINGISGMIGAAVAKAGELAAGVAGAVKGALGINSPSTVMHGFGENAGQGFINGLESQKQKIIDLATALMQAIKDVFGSAEGLTINFNLGGAQTAMQGIASSAQDFSTAMNTAVPAMTKGANKIDADTRAELDKLDIQKAQLSLQIQQLQAQKNMAGDKGQKSALQQQIDQLQIQRQQLTMTQQQLEYQSKYSGEVGTTAENYSDLLKQTAQMPMDFARNVGGQFMSDLGIGGGALTAAVDQGLQFGEQFIFNVLSMDDALSGQQRIQNKKSLQFTQR